MGFHWFKRKNFGNIADGTSNTVAISECLTPSTYLGTKVRENVAVLGETNAISAPANAAAGCTNHLASYGVGGNFPDNLIHGGQATDYGRLVHTRGLVFTHGSVGANMFSTLSPPNSPMCAWGGGRYQGNLQLPPGSYHNGGVNCGLFDGSVRFIPNTIDSGRQIDPAVTSGPSPYGVWGALGSPDGGDSTSL